MVKDLLASAEDLRDLGSVPGWRRFPGEGHGNPLHYSFLENPMDRGAWQATVCGITELDMNERLAFSIFHSSLVSWDLPHSGSQVDFTVPAWQTREEGRSGWNKTTQDYH